MIWSVILAWTAERKVNVHHNSCIKVQEIFLFLGQRMGVQLLLYIKARLPYRDVKNWMWLPWDIQRKNFLLPIIVVRILFHLDSAPKMYLCSCTLPLAKEHIWKSVGISGLLEWQVEEWLWRERPLRNTSIALGFLTKKSEKENHDKKNILLKSPFPAGFCMEIPL